MSRYTMPTLPEIARISPTMTSEVSDDLVETANVHMGLSKYVAVAAEAVWIRQGALGLSEAREDGTSFFVSEQHTRYLGELLLGDSFTAHPRFLARSARALHTVTYIVDVTRGRLACAVDSVSVCVSMTTRRSSAIPRPLADKLDHAIRADAAALGTPPPYSAVWHQAVTAGRPDTT